MIRLKFPRKLLLSPAALAFVLAGPSVLAHAQQDPYDPTTFTVFPVIPISTEPLTLSSAIRYRTARLPTSVSSSMPDNFPKIIPLWQIVR